MAEISVTPQAIGKTLKSNIYSRFNGILFEKGHTITERDLEFLRAFKVSLIPVEDRDVRVKNSSKREEERRGYEHRQSPFVASQDYGIDQMEQIMDDLATGSSVPVSEIRKWLKPLIDEVEGPTGWIKALKPIKEAKRYTYYHNIGVALISAIIARNSSYPENEIMQVALAGLLCDIGLTRIDKKMLLKSGPLTREEHDEMKKHTIYGYQILKDTVGISQGVALAALQHHEREDGSGYPLGVKSAQIHPYAKIVAIADVVHAMCSTRVYKEGESPFRVLEYLRYENLGRFDPSLIHKFVSSITQLPLGTQVRLNDGRIGKIIYVDGSHPTRPVLDINGEILSLNEHQESFIEEILL